MLSAIQSFAQSLYSQLEATGVVDANHKDILHSLIEEQLKKSGFVSREEFDVQAKILERSVLQVQQLEAQISALETELKTLSNA